MINLTEPKICKGGHNPPMTEETKRPPAPKGSNIGKI